MKQLIKPVDYVAHETINQTCNFLWKITFFFCLKKFIDKTRKYY